jgi:hypothetical protein
MNFPGQITALDPRDLKRYPVDVAGIPNRGAQSLYADRALSFPEVAAKVADEQARDLETNPPTEPAKPAKRFALWEQEEFGFRDLIDIINPLQHIPIVATLYRHMTGEKIGAVPRVIGGALWGRIGGFVSGLVNVFVDWFTGKDIGDHIYSALFGDPSDSTKQTAVAQAAKGTLSPPLAAPAAPELVAVPLQLSPEPVLETDHLGEPVQSSNGKEPVPLSSVSPMLIPDVVSQALISSYVRGRRHEDSDEDSPRLYVRV